MVSTYGSKKAWRYAYYETRKDLARPGDPPSLRFQRGQLEQHLIGHMEGLLNDEHALRCLSGAVEAAQLRTIFAAVVTADAGDVSSVELTLRSLIAATSSSMQAL